mmetsp:Transcript_5278/g.8168  ORF Transcript_5278/g.8168 Transcript_5278/m.8168 type:complete len:117 (+) Transcript_5278:1022-1372(+)
MMAGSWMCIFISLFNILAGNGIINMYSTAIFDGAARMGSKSPFSAKESNQFIGLSGLLGAIISYSSVTVFSRRTIFIGGHFLMSILLFTTGLFIEERRGSEILIAICSYLVVYQAT